MNPLRTTVLMKTDIGGSTSRFRELLAADLQAFLSEHRDFLTRHAAKHGGHIIKAAGDGYWLEFPGVTGAAKAAIEMQEELRLAQPNRGDDRIAIRIVITLGSKPNKRGRLLLLSGRFQTWPALSSSSDMCQNRTRPHC